MKTKALLLSLFSLSLIFTLFAQTSVNKTETLRGLYATSNAIDFGKSGPQKLFDGTDTPWIAMPGAAPNEGIMLYFEKPVYIKSMTMTLPKSDSYAKIKTIGLYVNGADLNEEYNASDPVTIDKSCSSLYIRILDVDGITKRENSNPDGSYYTYKSYKSDKPAAISELVLIDKSGSTITVIPPLVVSGSITPSSTLQPEEAYHAGYLFDGRTDSGWVEGNKGSGTGEKLTFTFNSSATITKLRIANGMQLSETHYKANERVKSFSFFADTDSGKKYQLPDSMAVQIVPLEKPLTGKSFSFTITDIYAGTKYKDTVISEIQFFDGTQWFSLNSGRIEKRKAALISSLKNSVMANIVDKMYLEKSSYDTGDKSCTAIFRSDSSFVIWLEDYENDYTSKSTKKVRVLDGFWQVVSANGQEAQITLYGRNSNLYELTKMYQGTTTTESVTIFSDTVTITSSGMKGKKFFGSLSF